MVQTGRRADLLKNHLVAGGLEIGLSAPRPSLGGLSDALLSELDDLYRRLGGIEERPAFRPGAWDLSLDGGLVIELDEELHFNRYRALTLETSWSAALPWREAYQEFTRERETECLRAGRWGRRWTSPSTSRMFRGGEPGDFSLGSPRWKQRALYDSIKDLIGTVDANQRLSRISVFDSVEGLPVGDALAIPSAAISRALVGLVGARTVGSPVRPEPGATT